MATETLDPQRDKSTSDPASPEELEKQFALSSAVEPVYEKPGNEPDTSKSKDSNNNNWYRSASSKDDDRARLANTEAAGGEKKNSLYKKFDDSLHEHNTLDRLKQSLFIRNRRRTIAGGGLLGVVISLIFAFSLAQGPLQFVHFAQLLQQFHFAHNQDFSDRRSMKVIINAINDRNNNSRLGRIANRYANKWEGQLIKDTGLKPIYRADVLNRFAGFEVVNEDLAKDYLNDFQEDGVNTRGSPTNLVDKNGKPISNAARVVDLKDESALARRSLIRTVGKGTDTTKVISAIGSRLLIKRGGVDFHPLKNVVRSATESFLDYRKKVKNAEAEENRTGLTDVVPDEEANSTKDTNGKPITDPNDINAANESNELIKEAEAAGQAGLDGSSTLKELQAKFTKASGPALVIGVLCAVRAFGDNIPNFQYLNVVLPELRIGARTVTTGNQIMSGQDVNTDELGAYSPDFTNSTDNTSWIDARSIQAELGQPLTGPDIPNSAKPGNVGDKPRVFDILDQLPFMGTACFLAGGFLSHIPVINNVASWGSEQLFSAIDAVIASVAGSQYTTQSLLDDALRVAAGMSVNLYAQGAELGNIANYGARLAANDQSLSMGGRALDSNEVAQLDNVQQQFTAYDESHESLITRLFNPSDSNSAVAKFIDYSPNTHQLGGWLGNLPSALSNSLGSIMKLPSAKVSAAQSYSYGFPEYGFSTSEQNNHEFDNPDENAAIVEPQLAQLNTKYGNCFSMEVVPDPSNADGIVLENGSAVNYYDVATKYPQCADGSDMLLRYRFYLADAVTVASLSCFEGDDSYCTQLGFGTAADNSDATNPTTAPSGSALPTGTAKDLATQLLQYVNTGKIKCTTTGCPDIANTASGKSIRAGSCQVDALNAGLLGMLLKLVQLNHTFTLSALCSDHSTVDGLAGHNGGRAADFNTIDGVFMGPNADDPWTQTKIDAAKKLDQDIASFMPRSTGFGQVGPNSDKVVCHPTFGFLSGFDTFGDSCHHQHVQVEI